MKRKWINSFFSDGTIKELIYKDSDISNEYFFYPESSSFKGPCLYIDDGDKTTELNGNFIIAEKKILVVFRIWTIPCSMIQILQNHSKFLFQ